MMRRMLALSLLLTAAGCAPRSETSAPRVELARELPGLHNVCRVTDKLLSGSSPEGEAGFESLARLGVRTVISVDGARPEVELGRRHGLHYVHLPIGYDGVPREQALRIARAVRDLPGPIYLHCHHGKHRGPAAAAAARRCLDGQFTVTAALDFLREAGTDPHYEGLYASVERATAVTAAELDAVSDEFPEVANVAAIVQTMVSVEKRWDGLNALRAAGWRAPPEAPDLDPPHEALQLRELYREALRLPAIATKPARFRQLLADAEETAADLEAALRKDERLAAERAFRRSRTLCSRCHDSYRDGASRH